MLHFRGGRQAISQKVYPDLEDFYADLAAAYRAEIADLATRGCRYLQMDDTNLAYLCDPKIRERTKERGDDPDALTTLYCRLVNDTIRARQQDMTVRVRSDERSVGKPSVSTFRHRWGPSHYSNNILQKIHHKTTY